MVKKYGAFMSDQPAEQKSEACTSGRKSEVRELKSGGDEYLVAGKLDKKFLNKADIDLLFPTQLKSYYASSEF